MKSFTATKKTTKNTTTQSNWKRLKTKMLANTITKKINILSKIRLKLLENNYIH